MAESLHQQQNSPDLINWPVALEATGGDEELLLEIVTAFMDEAPSAMSEIRQAVDQRDAKGLQVSAHKLKGSLRIFGSPKTAYEYAWQLEQIGLKSDPSTPPVEEVTPEDWARAGELCGRLGEELQPILKAMMERANS